ncbi:hypothetical protein BR93DRAFT_969343 [Coniochaeta sp. PMI_546]|nr:hypothetical protein BR93DRAFT_969343 [Coniochaeta sp. PMI_546]
MSIDRRKHQHIALADILVDQAQYNSESDSEVPKPDRMQIHIDMPKTKYLNAPHPNSITSTGSGGPQSTTATYQEMTPFSTVSSFNFPATADASLLTPISSAGSPPIHQRVSTKGTMRAYHRSQASSNAQQPTPPSTSTGVYYPPYDLSSSSQSPSPLTVHPHATEINMTPYMRQSPNHMHGHPSPKDDVPPPSNPYLGHYTVSCDESDMSNSFRDYPNFNEVDQVDPSIFARGPGGQVSHMHPHMMTTSAGPAPILAHPDPIHYRMQMAPRAGEIEDLRHTDVLTMGHPGQPPYQSQRVTTASRRKPRVKKEPSVQKRPASRPLAQQTLRAMGALGQDNDAESLGEGTEAVVLSDKCEDDARFIFETRINLVKSGMKGKGMWEEISRKYEEVYGQRLEKATLQMRLTRTFAKHAIWPEKEIERLKEAFDYVEKERYKSILDRMKQIGGGQCWSWTPQLIEAKLIDLGYEEANIDEKTNTRKRRRLARRRRAAAAQQNPSLLHGGETWTNALGLHHGAMHAPIHHDNEDSEDMIPNYTPDQRDSYIEEVVSRIKPEQEDSSPDPDMMDVSYQRNEDNRDQSHHQNTRVAKQAVEHLMLNGIRM